MMIKTCRFSPFEGQYQPSSSAIHWPCPYFNHQLRVSRPQSVTQRPAKTHSNNLSINFFPISSHKTTLCAIASFRPSSQILQHLTGALKPRHLPFSPPSFAPTSSTCPLPPLLLLYQPSTLGHSPSHCLHSCRCKCWNASSVVSPSPRINNMATAANRDGRWHGTTRLTPAISPSAPPLLSSIRHFSTTAEGITLFATTVKASRFQLMACDAGCEGHSHAGC